MTTSENGIRFLKDVEGYVAVPETDTTRLSWGYGHNRVGNEPIPSFVSRDVADALLRHDLPSRENAVSKLAPWCNQNQFDALVSFTYNEGIGGLQQLVSHGEDQITEQMLRWDVVMGQHNAALKARRLKEIALYES